MGGQRVRGFFAIVGGTAVAGAAAAIVMTSPAPQSPIDPCALVPSITGCTPPLNGGSGSGASLHPNGVATSTVIPQGAVGGFPNH
jgi:hypothetical protein